jgi:hypothetical protein
METTAKEAASQQLIALPTPTDYEKPCPNLL